MTKEEEPEKDKNYPFLLSPRCGAKTRKGKPCRSPAMPNGRCRMHGGKSTGPKTEAGRKRCSEARLIHGFYSKEYQEIISTANKIIKEAKAFLAEMPSDDDD